MEVAAGVHQLHMRGADTFVIGEERFTLIDAGMAGSRRILEPQLHELGRSLGDLERIICTHGHPDHIGGVNELVGDRDDVEVLMHPADLAGLQLPLRAALARSPHGRGRRGRLIQYLTPVPARCMSLEDATVLPLLGGLRVVHTPGHTPGSVCLYAEKLRLLFTGDVLQVIRGRLAYASWFFSHDHAEARASVERLAALDVEIIAMSHYPPWKDNPNGTLRDLVAAAAT